MPLILPILLGLLVAFATQCAAASQFVLSANTRTSSDGAVTLSWSGSAGQQVYIERDNHAGFTRPAVVYRGTDGASVLTGLTDGQYFFRGRYETAGIPASAWSNTVEVKVKHHSLGRALVFFALGAVVFLATLLLVMGGARREKMPE